jgi:regulator of replication initiation timing
MSFLSKIIAWANEGLGTGFSEDASEAEVLRGLNAVNENLSQLPTLSESLASMREEFTNLKSELGQLTTKLGEIQPVNVEEIQANVTQAVQASVTTQIETVNTRVTEVAGKVATIKSGVPIQSNNGDDPAADPPVAREFAKNLSSIKEIKLNQ